MRCWPSRRARRGPREAQLALAALQALRGPAAAPVARLLAELCALYELSASAEVLDCWLEQTGAAAGGQPERSSSLPISRPIARSVCAPGRARPVKNTCSSGQDSS